jgi:phage shock protein A
MTYFSRLTDIVTCRLTAILEKEADPQAAIAQIIREMEEGQQGARRSVTTSAAQAQRIADELRSHKKESEYWSTQAKKELAEGHEDQARAALTRKREIADVIAGLEDQHQAAVATHEHLMTMLRALEARLAEARRKQTAIAAGEASGAHVAGSDLDAPPALDDHRAAEIEAELAALKAELGK